MWVFVFFDLPTETKQDKKEYLNFRKRILAAGFCMFQFSAYRRHCPTIENADVHIRRVKRILPPHGNVGILRLTDLQYKKMIIFQAQKQIMLPESSQQLEFF